MKKFIDILLESKKTYIFRIGVAGVISKDFLSKLSTCLEKYQLITAKSIATTPIQKRPLDFPNLQNMEVTFFEVELGYPTTTQILEEYIGQYCCVDRSHLVVRGINEPQEEYQESQTAEPYEPLLTKTDMGGESAQHCVGNNRVMELLKELEKARADRDHEPSCSVVSSDSSQLKTDNRR